MSEFFKPWRRKVACATLAITCVLTVGWVRSEYTLDAVRIALPGIFDFTFYSEFSHLDWHETGIGEHWRVPMWLYSMPHEENMPTGDNLESLREQRLGLTNDLFPYALIVVPLTVLSAILLLVNPRSFKRP